MCDSAGYRRAMAQIPSLTPEQVAAMVARIERHVRKVHVTPRGYESGSPYARTCTRSALDAAALAGFR